MKFPFLLHGRSAAEPMNVCVYIVVLLGLIAGCGPQFALPESKDRPAQIVVSAYTQNGCLEDLQEAANRAGSASG